MPNHAQPGNAQQEFEPGSGWGSFWRELFFGQISTFPDQIPTRLKPFFDQISTFSEQIPSLPFPI